MAMAMAMAIEMEMEMEMEMNNFLLLPPEITADILSRVPTDSVLECKLVCKTWRSLIDHPSFVNAHTRHIFLDDSNSASMGFFISTHIIGGTGDEFKLHFGEFNEDDDDDEVISFKLSNPITHHPYPLETHNLNIKCQFDTVNIISCNGLIFTASSVHPLEILFIYNPFTKDYVDLLHSFVTGCISSEVYFECFIANGFGYHLSTNEYKIVRICYSFANHDIGGHVSVYTLGSGKWRSKGEISYSLFGRNPGVFANGVIYWLERHDKKQGNKRIVSFDLGDEEFRIVPLPLPQTRDVELGVLRGHLCVISPKYVNDKNSSDVWILKNKECSSWTRKFNVPWKCDLGELVGISKSGKILLHSNDDGCLFSYDPKTESLCGVKDAPALESFHMIPYMKSFVSLRGLGEEDAKCMDMPSSNSFEFGWRAQIMATLVIMVKYYEFRGQVENPG